MLTELRAENYKSFRSETTCPIRQITVLLGKNNSGKTAAARVPLLVLSALGSPQRSPASPLPLQVRGLVYGSSLLELTHGQLPHAPFTLGATIAHSYRAPYRVEPVRISFSVQHRQSLQFGQSAFISEFSALPFVGTIRWQRQSASVPKEITYDDQAVGGFRGVLPILKDLRSKAVDLVQSNAADQLRQTVHLRSIRASIQTIYENRLPLDTTEPSGAEVPYMLNADDELMYFVSRWYGEELEIKGMSVESSGSAFSLALRARADEGPNLSRVGQGAQQVLPVTTFLVGMARNLVDVSFLTIEEPELHLHPAAHGALADLVVAAANRRDSNQILIETHSENFLLRLRRRVAEGLLRPEQLRLLWFEQTAKEGSVVRQIDVREDGSVGSWPRGIFAEDLQEVQGIIRAGRT